MDRNAGRSRAIPDRCGAQNAALCPHRPECATDATVFNVCMLWFTGTWRQRSPSQNHTATGRRSSLLAPSSGRCSRTSGRLPTATLRPSTSASVIGASGQRSRATRRRSSQSAWHMHAHSRISLFFPSLRHVYSHAPLSHRQTGSYCNAGRWNRRAAPSSRPSCRFSMSCYVNTATIGRRPHQGARAAHGAPPAVEDEDTYSHCIIKA